MDYKKLIKIADGAEVPARYKQVKSVLGRLGFVPNGRNSEEWDFTFTDYDWSRSKGGAWYSVQVYLDENGDELGEYRLQCECGNTEDSDETFNTFDEMVARIKELKKANKISDANESLDHLDINNYYAAENKGVQVGDQFVIFTCNSDPSAAQSTDIEEDYPYVYEVEVYLNHGQDDEQRGEGSSKQWSSEDSAWYDGFIPAYKQACRQIGATPLCC